MTDCIWEFWEFCIWGHFSSRKPLKVFSKKVLISGGQISFSMSTKLRARSCTQKVLDTIWNISLILYYLNITYRFPFMCLHQSWRNETCKLNPVLLVKQDAPQKTIEFYYQTHPSKGVCMKILKAYNLSKNRLCHEFFD